MKEGATKAERLNGNSTSDFALENGGCALLYSRMPPADLGEHSHPEIQIGLCLERGTIDARWHTAAGSNKSKILLGGEVSIIPSNQPHAAAWHQETPLFTVFLSPESLSSAADEATIGRFEIIERYGVRDPLIENLTGSLLNYFRQGFPVTDFYLDAFRTVLAHHLVANHSTASNPHYARDLNRPEFLNRAAEFIEDNLEKNLTLRAVARVAAMSEFHFARFFKSSAGRTVHQYILERRLERARLALEDANLSITEIAARYGFASSSHFAAAFRRRFSTTPTAYRRCRSI